MPENDTINNEELIELDTLEDIKKLSGNGIMITSERNKMNLHRMN